MHGSVIVTLARGDLITIDGSSGGVFAGAVPTVEATLGDDMLRLLTWCEKARRMGVRTNTDTPEQARKAIELGADGIGLCRTEHMFFADDRILAMREMILARSESQRRAALAKLLPFQTSDFVRRRLRGPQRLAPVCGVSPRTISRRSCCIVTPP